MSIDIKINNFDKLKIINPQKIETKSKNSIIFTNEVLSFLAYKLRTILLPIINFYGDKIEEIRIRESRPLMVRTNENEVFIDSSGKLNELPINGYKVTTEDIENTLQLISQSSVYALEEELRQGFITLRGGHRIGITGRAVLEAGKVKTLKHINGFNIRISKEIKGVANKVLPYIYDIKNRTIYNTLLISPPRCGKTTLLRDMIKHLSDGLNPWRIPGLTIGLVDERSEIAGCFHGIPQNDVGIRTDILDCCPKAEGMSMLIRTMGPEIIATDEIGPKEDIQALEEVLNAGVKVLSTVHGRDISDISKRPNFKYMLEQKIFDRYIILSRKNGVGTIEDVLDKNCHKL